MSNLKELSKQFEDMIGHYLESSSKVQNRVQIHNTAPELEIRFGTNPKQAKSISKVDYLQVVNTLYANGWKPLENNPKGKQFLRIIPEELVINKNYKPEKETDAETETEPEAEPDADSEAAAMEGGAPAKKSQNKSNQRTRIRSSKIRAEIFDTQWIQQYCKHNDLVKLKDDMLEAMRKSNVRNQKKQIKFTEKFGVKQTETTYFQKIHFSDFNFNVSYQMEKDYSVLSKDPRIQTIYNDWTIGKKIFRSINRVRFEHPDVPMFVDISIVKTNRKYQKNKQDQYSNRPLPKETIQDADVFNTNPVYEIEIELNNDVMNQYQNNSKALMKQIRHTIRLILSGLQGTPYPTSYDTHETILNEYMTTMHGDSWLETKKPRVYFAGPNSVALQMENVMKSRVNLETVECITENYCVTEKADGERCIMYVASDGKIYMISRTLKVMFTGSITKIKSCYNSIVDGEFIYYGKQQKRLYQFSAFDIYFIGGRKNDTNVRSFPFISYDETVLETRYNMLKEFQEKLEIQSVTTVEKCNFHFVVKDFMYVDPYNPSYSIYHAAREIWNRRKTYPYEIDGLIYTPMSYGVGGNEAKKASTMGYNFTWNCSFKWKPPQYNSIDFLVVTEKDKQNRDLIRSFVSKDTVTQYKTLYLMVGFDSKSVKFMNPFDELIYDKLPPNEGLDKTDSNYKVKPFVPTTPYNPKAYVCYMPLVDDGKGLQMKTLEGEYFDENMIVEFQYNTDLEKEHPWKWTPMRIRHDKTQSLTEGKKSMNVFKNANDVWKTIHYPITIDRLTNIEHAKMTTKNEVNDVYYNAVEKSTMKTKNMRDFHNLYVKSKLIVGVSDYVQTQPNHKEVRLIDYAVGKAGDLSKWARANLKFVLGIDYSNDNIHNHQNGACVRFLQHRCNNRKSEMRGLFVEGNSKLNIRNKSAAIVKPFEKDLVQFVFGQKNLPDGNKLAIDYGIAKDGFHISSCQFAIHYFFEKRTTLYNFLQNLSECTQLNGYFVGTCFDGQKVFDTMKSVEENSSYRVTMDDKMIFEIEKQYPISLDELKSDESSVGLPISVYLESIGQPIVEYLVHFEYLKRVMENYGFQLVEQEEAKKLGFPTASGLFDTLYKTMKKESDMGSDLYIRDALKMTMEEKAVSYLYRYFIFKKIRQISPATLKNMLNEVVEESSEEPSSPKYDTMTPSPSPSPLSPTEPIQFTTKKEDKEDKDKDKKEEDKTEDEQVKEPEMPKMKMKKIKGKKFRL